MIVLLLESEYNCINSVVDYMTTKYDRRSVVKIDSKYVDREVLADVSHKPLLDNGWLILCTARVPASVVKAIDKPFNNVIVKVTSHGQLGDVQEKLSGMGYKFIDNYVLEEEAVKTWIESRLQCSKRSAELVYTRCGKKLRYVAAAVDTLSLLDTLDERTICKYVEKVNTVSVSDVVLYLLGIQRNTVSESEVLKTVSRFRYAYKWMLDTVESDLLLYQQVYGFVSSGELSLQNYKSFRTLCSDKKISGLSEYRLKQMVQSFDSISMEYLYYLCSYVERIPRQYFGIYRLMYLIKIVGRMR